MDRHGIDTHFFACTVNAKCNLSAVSDENFFEHRMPQLFYAHEGFAELYRLPILHINLGDTPRCRRWDLVHGFHGFDNEDRLTFFDLAAHLHKWRGAGCRA